MRLLLYKSLSIKQVTFSLLLKDCQKAPVTCDIASYFPSFTGYDSLVKRENVGEQMVLLPPECRLTLLDSTST